VERFKTDGHDLELPDGTVDWSGNDADIWTATQRFTTSGDGREFDLFTGYAQRAYGAVDFYAPYDSWERTRTLFAAARYNQRLGGALTLEPRFSLRRHADRFVLLRGDPQFYYNDHVTRVVNGELRGLLDLGDCDILALSLEGAYEDIVSEGVRSGVTGPALGEHLRRRASVAAEYDHHGPRWGWQLGLRTDLRSQQAGRVTGTGALSWALSPGLHLKGGAGSVYRVPTYTELYYTDPANVGDSGLAPELGWAWELGCEGQKGPWFGQATYFERREEDRIEWVRDDPADSWRAGNIAEGFVHGWELKGGWNHRRGHSLEIGWAGLSQSRTLPAGYEGKYELLTPRDQWLGAGTLAMPFALDLTLTGRYQEHSGGPDDFRHIFVLDGRLGWRHRLGWFASLTGTNLLDRSYQEVPGVTMPGTLLTATVGRSF
jgi:iron complex outermembrane receptor protein